MNIVLKQSKSGWLKVSDEISVLVGYYSMQQEEKLKQILYEVGAMPPMDNPDKFTKEEKDKLDLLMSEFPSRYKGRLLTLVDADINNNGLSPKEKADLMGLNERYFKLFIKYTIKDWKGVKTSSGEDVPFVLMNDEMDTTLWQNLCRSMKLSDIYELHKLIKNEIEFTETDKKK